jgi:hypothetical protein
MNTAPAQPFHAAPLSALSRRPAPWGSAPAYDCSELSSDPPYSGRFLIPSRVSHLE